MAVSLSDLFIYPVKSLGAIAQAAWEVQPRGLKYDRRWMVVDPDGRFITQREIPRMALVEPRIHGASLILSAPEMPPLSLPLELPGCSPALCVRVWRSECMAHVAGDEANSWLSHFLKTPCRLVYMPEETRREVNPEYRAGEGIVSFADGYPLMLIGQASLDDLNSRLKIPVPMSRFRPSMVVSGTSPFAEDHWKTIRVGEAVFHVVKPCDRCIITTIDQKTSMPQGDEPLKTLSTYRLRGQKVLFGQFLIPDAPSELGIGDAIEVLQTKE